MIHRSLAVAVSPRPFRRSIKSISSFSFGGALLSLFYLNTTPLLIYPLMSVAPPLSHTPSHTSTTSRKHKSSSAEKHKDRDKDRDNDNDNDRDTKTRHDHDDVFSVKSRSIQSSSATDSSTASSTTIDTLRLMSGNGVRRSKCRADFVEELARGSGGLAVLGKGIAEKLNIIAGKEGITFFRKFIQ